MGKGDTKTNARKNRAKLAKALSLPALAPTKSSRKRRDDNGKFTGPQEDARLTALNARCRHNALPETDDNRRTVSHPAYEGHATRVILHAGRDSDRLLTLWGRIDADHHAYFLHVLNRPRFPNVAKMEILPDPFEARPDDRPDLRTPEEKASHAKAAWNRWRNLFKAMTGHERVMIDDGIYGVREFVRDGKPTTSGMAFVAALRVVQGMVEK